MSESNVPSILGSFKECVFQCDNCNAVADAGHMEQHNQFYCVGCGVTIFKVRWSDGTLATKLKVVRKEIILINKNQEFYYVRDSYQ